MTEEKTNAPASTKDFTRKKGIYAQNIMKEAVQKVLKLYGIPISDEKPELYNQPEKEPVEVQWPVQRGHFHYSYPQDYR